jgi:hypothetical protein
MARRIIAMIGALVLTAIAIGLLIKVMVALAGHA